ncbi:extracellular solute-binding protein [Streptomyces sp. NBC_00576]|nr:extracellular solute-binding protein [Streptomyces sp. NBC_00576]
MPSSRRSRRPTPGVRVRYTVTGTDQYQQQIRTQLSSGTAPDVMSVWPGNGNAACSHCTCSSRRWCTSTRC